MAKKKQNLLTDEKSGQSGCRVAIDLYSCAAEQLAQPQTLNDFLVATAASLGLDLRAPVTFQDDAGGFSLAAAGDKAYFFAHAFPTNRHLFIDIFSVVNFSHEQVLSSAVTNFQARRHELSCVRQEISPANLPELAGYCRTLS